jgi:hypothetical protein
MKFVLLAAVVCSLGCAAKRVDPLADARQALQARESSAVPDDWATHASLVLTNAAVDDVLVASLQHAINEGLSLRELSMFGMSLSMESTAQVSDATVRADDACETCVRIDAVVAGEVTFLLSGRLGSRETARDWDGSLSGVFTFELGDDVAGDTVLRTRPVAAESWQAEIALQGVHEGWLTPFLNTFEGELRQMVSRPDLPSVTLTRLPGLDDAGVRAFALRTTPDAVVIDFHFDLLTEPNAYELPVISGGWALVLPQDTLLGLIEARTLREPVDLERQALPAWTSMTLSGENQFEIGMDAVPTREKGRVRQLLLRGDVSLTDSGELALAASSGEWIANPEESPDLAVWLAGDRVLGSIVQAARGMIPMEQSVPFAGSALMARPSGLSVEDGAIVVSGTLAVE